MLLLNSLDVDTSDIQLIHRYQWGEVTKSYAVTLRKSGVNTLALGGKRRQPCTYHKGNITLYGYLVVLKETPTAYECVFVAGNGALWQKLEGVMLPSLPVEDLNFTMGESFFNSMTAAASPNVILDITDRGRFVTTNGIDISNMYPAIKVAELIRRIANFGGASLRVFDGIGDFENYYLLYTDRHKRNSEKWEREAAMLFKPHFVSRQNNTQPAGPMAWSMVIDEQPAPSNFTNGEYIVPETGTYNIKLSIGGWEGNFEDNLGNPAVIRVSGSPGLMLRLLVFRNGVQIGGTATYEFGYHSFNITKPRSAMTLPVQLSANDIIKPVIQITADVSYVGGGTVSRFTALFREVEIQVQPSRWYGGGSVVEIKDILPNISALTFLSNIVNHLGCGVYYNSTAATLTLLYGSQVHGNIIELTPLDVTDMGWELGEVKNLILKQERDKVLQPPDAEIKFAEASGDEVITLPYSRFPVFVTHRMGGPPFRTQAFPTLWDEGDPSTIEGQKSPPPLNPEAAPRIARRGGLISYPESFLYTLNNGSHAYTAAAPSIRELSDVDVTGLQLLARGMPPDTCTFYARIADSLVVSGELFWRPVHVGGANIKILEAEDVGGGVYRCTGRRLGVNNIITT